MSIKLDSNAGASGGPANSGTDLTAGVVAVGLALQANMQAGQTDTLQTFTRHMLDTLD